MDTQKVATLPVGCKLRKVRQLQPLALGLLSSPGCPLAAMIITRSGRCQHTGAVVAPERSCNGAATRASADPSRPPPWPHSRVPGGLACIYGIAT